MNETDHNAREKQLQLILQYAAENRRAEISLLWTRSSFFWAFLGIGIASFGSAIGTQHRTLAVIVACFAAICSLCWTLANRAGKYWQEVWEKKVESVEKEALGNALFSRESNPDVQESWFWGAKQYSPSRLTCAVSDLTLAVWCFLALGVTLIDVPQRITLIRASFLIGTTFYAVGILVWCKSGAARPSNLKEAWSGFSGALRRWINAFKADN
jgi:hypothetical protein